METQSKQDLKTEIVDVLKSVYDPEIPVNIYELGLVYEININEANEVDIKMTLTSPACPVAGTLPPEVESKVKGVDAVADAKVEIVWDPAWTPDMMSEEAKLELGFL